jgi:hypothetical protein
MNFIANEKAKKYTKLTPGQNGNIFERNRERIANASVN